MTIEGIPEGWEFVKIGHVYCGDKYVDGAGNVATWDYVNGESNCRNYVIVKLIEPPKPTYIPWTRDTCPVGMVIVLGHSPQLVIAAEESGCFVGRGDYFSYSELVRNDKITLNGEPCGTKVRT